MADVETRENDPEATPPPPAPEPPVIAPILEAALEKPEEPRKPPCTGCGSRESIVRSTQGSTRYRRCSRCGRDFATTEILKR